MEPELLLLDEPLSNLDAKLRVRLRFELKRIQREVGLTTIYVTHDQGEALALSHEIAVMNEGRIVQIGTPQAIYDHPRTKFVADFIGTTNFIPGMALGRDTQTGRWNVRTARRRYAGAHRFGTEPRYARDGIDPPRGRRIARGSTGGKRPESDLRPA